MWLLHTPLHGPQLACDAAQPARALHSAERNLPACTDGFREEDTGLRHSPDQLACNHVNVWVCAVPHGNVCLEQSKLRRAVGVTRTLDLEDLV